MTSDQTTPDRTPATSRRGHRHELPRPGVAGCGGRRPWSSSLIGVLLFGPPESPYFLNTTNLFYIGLNMGEIAIMALPLTLIVMTGEIDLSVASMLGLSGTLVGYLFHHGWSIWPAMAAVLLVGAVGGALNGVLVTRLGLPSIAVTIGTLTLFRGIAEIVLGTNSITGFPTCVTNIGVVPIQGTVLPGPILIFLVLALVFGVVLQATPLGRSIFAIGLQSEAAHFSGIRVDRIKFWLFVLSGLVCSFAGILWTLRFASARYDAGHRPRAQRGRHRALRRGLHLRRPRRSIFGVVLAVVIVGCIQEALTLMNVAAEVQNIVTGGLLLVSVIVPNGADGLKRIRARIHARRRHGRGPTRSPAPQVNRAPIRSSTATLDEDGQA